MRENGQVPKVRTFLEVELEMVGLKILERAGKMDVGNVLVSDK